MLSTVLVLTTPVVKGCAPGRGGGARAPRSGTATAIALEATIAKITDRASAANVSHVTIELCAIAIGSFEFRTQNVITIWTQIIVLVAFFHELQNETCSKLK